MATGQTTDIRTFGSQGQQRTAALSLKLAEIELVKRAIKDTPVLLLDEATSALDAGTEEAVLGNLRSMTDKTVIIVTHRPAALKQCDRQVAFGEEK